MSSDTPYLTEGPASWLTGQLLIAMPGMADERFTKSVIYICSHGPNGAMGLVVNRLYASVNLGEGAGFRQLLDQLEIAPSTRTPDLPVHFGGPVETGRGFVLHSIDYRREGTIQVDEQTGLSATIDILQSIADGAGPERVMMALGYTGWAAGQLDAEIKANGWLTAPASGAILFDDSLDTKWGRALASIGISPLMLSGEAGHA